MESSSPRPHREPHGCPGPGAHTPGRETVPYEQLACPRHWYQVSKATRKAVWRAWEAGDFTAHTRAIHLAIRQMHA